MENSIFKITVSKDNLTDFKVKHICLSQEKKLLIDEEINTLCELLGDLSYLKDHKDNEIVLLDLILETEPNTHLNVIGDNLNIKAEYVDIMRYVLESITNILINAKGNNNEY